MRCSKGLRSLGSKDNLHELFQLETSSKCDIKAENSSTLCKCREGRKGLRWMGSNADLMHLRQASSAILNFLSNTSDLEARLHAFCAHDLPQGGGSGSFFAGNS